MAKRAVKVRRLQLEYLHLLESLQPQPPPESPSPEVTELVPEMPPPLTPEEIAELQSLPMPDPLEEIEHRLGLSTMPPSPVT